MIPELVQWTCNPDTRECLWIDQRVLNAIICLILALVAVGLGWLIDALIRDLKRPR
jgi:capsule polysaccharide export protein KpsE/RkpR